ncbi:MAG: hypothetical protein ACKOK8_14020, partial [Planctomycetia bacterium]
PSGDWRAAVARQLPTAAKAPAATPAEAGGGSQLRPVTPVDVPALAESDWGNAELGPAIIGPVAKVLTTPTPAAPRRAAAPARRPTAALQGGTSVSAENGMAGPAGTVFTAAGIVFAVLRTTLSWIVGLLGTLVGRPMPGGSSSMVVAYRSFFGLLGRWTAWVSETSYTVSFILIILAVASGMIDRHALAAWLCWAIVALNLVGIAGDLTSLVTLSFRKNPIQGTLFLVPPLTLYYLWSDWQRYRDTVLRMRTPLLTLAAVAVAYLFVPWLHGGSKEEGRIVAAVKRAVDTVEENVAGRKDAIDEGLKKARSWLREVPLPDPASLPSQPDPLKPAHGHKP